MRVNESLLDRKIEGRFLAAHLFHWNASSRRLVMTGAGMPFPFVCRNGDVETVELEGVPLGLFRNIGYEETGIELSPGDFAISVSDGVSETVNSDGEWYGEGRLRRVLAASRGAPARAILERVFDELDGFCEGCSQSDDRTAVVLRVT